MELKHWWGPKVGSSFFQYRFEIPWLECLWFAKPEQRAACRWNVRTSNVKVTRKAKFVSPSSCPSLPRRTLAMRSVEQMDGWECGEAVVCYWSVFAHPLLCCEGKLWKGVGLNHYHFTFLSNSMSCFPPINAYCCAYYYHRAFFFLRSVKTVKTYFRY